MADSTNSQEVVLPAQYTPLRVLLIIALVYWVLVMGVWGMFAFDRGLTIETIFPVRCQMSLKDCLIYPDTLRPFNSLFLGLAHLLTFNRGSYEAYQLLYGALWWGKGFLTFLIFWRIFPQYPLVGSLIGALTIVHTSDYAFNLLGQMHQLGFLFFLVLAIYLFVEIYKSYSTKKAFILFVACLLAQFITLWTYEGHYLLILSVPILLLCFKPKLNTRLLMVTAGWYVLPLLYGFLLLQKYLLSKSQNYQASIIRTDLNTSTILHDWVLQVKYSLGFWQWVRPWQIGITVLAPVIAGLCVLGFVIGMQLLSPSGICGFKLPSLRQLCLLLCIGIVFSFLSFPIYILTKESTSFWRTQMLSSFGAAIVLGAGCLLLANLFPKPPYRSLLAISLCAAVVFTGVKAGVFAQAENQAMWQRHRQVMVQISHLIPDVEDQTLILVTNVPNNGEDPFFNAIVWFNSTVHLLYPNRQLAGIYVNDAGQFPLVPPWGHDASWRFTTQGIELDTLIWPQEKKLRYVNYNQVIVLRYDKVSGNIELLKEFPKNLLPEPIQATGYDPETRIKQTFSASQAIRMFGR